MKKMLKNTTLLSLILPLFIFSFLLSPQFASAQDSGSSTAPQGNNRMLSRMSSIAFLGGYNTNPEAASVPKVVGMVINALLSITGLIFIVLTVFAGFNWMTSQGNEEKIKKSQDTLKSSIIGLIITLSAWTIWNFIFVNLIL